MHGKRSSRPSRLIAKQTMISTKRSTLRICFARTCRGISFYERGQRKYSQYDRVSVASKAKSDTIREENELSHTHRRFLPLAPFARFDFRSSDASKALKLQDSFLFLFLLLKNGHFLAPSRDLLPGSSHPSEGLNPIRIAVVDRQQQSSVFSAGVKYSKRTLKDTWLQTNGYVVRLIVLPP